MAITSKQLFLNVTFAFLILHAPACFADAEALTRKAWESLASGEYAEMHKNAKQCMKNILQSAIDNDYNFKDTEKLTDKEAFSRYNEYLVESEFAECYYLDGLAYEKEQDCNSTLVYYSVIKMYPTVWTGWPGTLWQPAREAKEGLTRYRCTFENGG